MSAKASQIIKLAQSWIGKKESDGSHKFIIDIYNGHKPLARGYTVKYTDWWCATFISALAIKLGITDIIPTECGCGEMIELCKKLGIWIEDDAHIPALGDIVFYDWQDTGKGDNTGWPDHVGLVEIVDGNTITVIEGNINDVVGRRTIFVNEKNIRGYACPKYEPEVVAESEAKDVIIGTAVAKTTMKVRAASNTSGETVGYIKQSEEVEVLEILSNGWYKIAWKDGHAYTSNAGGGYFTYTPSTNVEIPTETPVETESVSIVLDELKKGSTGKQVKTLQCILVGYGYEIGNDPIDGNFGNQTEQGVKQYQAYHGLTVDGVVGKQTWTSLLK